MKPGGEVMIVYRDDDILVLCKPPGLATTSPDGGECLTALARELARSIAAPRLHPTSRLDKDVSGLVTFARTERAIRALLAARGRGVYERAYVGLAAAQPSPPAGTWRASIALDRRDPRRRVAVDSRDGDGDRSTARAAQTQYESTAVGVTGTCVLHMWPRTGRTHQLRVHAAAAGAPLLGDVHYGGPRRVVLRDGRVVSAHRVMLHCARVSFPHPAGGHSLAFEAELPADMRAVWCALGGTELDLVAVAGRASQHR